MRVLVTEGGAGQGHATVSVVRALAAAGHDVAVTVSWTLLDGGVVPSLHQAVLVPPSAR